jgi:hypothetical protein
MTKSILSAYPFRKVIKAESYSPTNNPHPWYPCSLILTLECGHESGRKASEGIPKKVRCIQCEKIR